MPLTLRNILQGSASAGTDALSTAGTLFDRAFKNFQGAAETVQEGKQAQYEKQSDVNTRELLSQLRGVTDEGEVPVLKSNFLDQATAKYGDQFDADAVDTALQSLKGNIRQTREEDRTYAENEALRGLRADQITDTGMDSIRQRLLGIEKTLDNNNISPDNREAARERLRSESGIDVGTYLDSLYNALGENNRSGQDILDAVGQDPAAKLLGINAADVKSWSDARKQATGEAQEEAVTAERDQAIFEAALERTNTRTEPININEEQKYIEENAKSLLGERWSDIGEKDRDKALANIPRWLNSGLTTAEILQLFGDYGRKSLLFGVRGSGTDFGGMEEAANKLILDKAIKASQQK